VYITVTCPQARTQNVLGALGSVEQNSATLRGRSILVAGAVHENSRSESNLGQLAGHTSSCFATSRTASRQLRPSCRTPKLFGVGVVGIGARWPYCPNSGGAPWVARAHVARPLRMGIATGYFTPGRWSSSERLPSRATGIVSLSAASWTSTRTRGVRPRAARHRLGTLTSALGTASPRNGERLSRSGTPYPRGSITSLLARTRGRARPTLVCCLGLGEP
jgi:hypothetical protein